MPAMTHGTRDGIGPGVVGQGASQMLDLANCDGCGTLADINDMAPVWPLHLEQSGWRCRECFPLTKACSYCGEPITAETGFLRIGTRFEHPACVMEQQQDPLPIVAAAGLVA